VVGLTKGVRRVEFTGRLATLAVAAALISPAVASGQCTFLDWARDQGYEPGDVMPGAVNARVSGIDSLDGIGDFDWTTTPTTRLELGFNQLSSIESGGFSGLTNLMELWLTDNGGLTATHALLSGNSAIDAGDPDLTPPPDFDQRGSPLSRVFDRVPIRTEPEPSGMLLLEIGSVALVACSLKQSKRRRH
jgi:hypothetical protein